LKTGNHINNKNRNVRSLRIWLLVSICLLSAAVGHGATIVFVTAPGANILGSAVDDRITFITSQNQVEIQIQNLELNISREIQAISAIDWLLHNTDNSAISQPTSIALVTSGETNLGQVINISGSTTYTTAALTSITNRWAISTSGQQIIGGQEISTFTGGSPSQLIIGPPNYNNPNNAVTGHNPFLETSDTTHISYVLTYGANSGVTGATLITQARLSFGTMFATTQELDLIPEVPEPGTIALSLAGIVLICLGRLRRERLTPAVQDARRNLSAQK
jgi:hypothetical protein